MKTQILILLFLFTFSNSILAQHSVGFNYSGKILGANYSSVSLFTLEYSPDLINEYVKIGITATGAYASINKDFIIPNTPIDVDDRSYSFAAFIRYFPIRNNLFALPFTEFELGYYFGHLIIDGKYCEESGFLDLSKSYYFKVGGGISFFPESKGHIIIGVDYLFHSPKVKYRKANCFPKYDYTEFTYTADLGLLLWKAGLQFDF